MVSIPTAAPVTIPPLTVAFVLLALHTPPGEASVNVVALPTHTFVAPVIIPASGNGLMVIALVADAVPQPFVTLYAMVSIPALTAVTVPPDTVA